jgi:dihydroorotate dehydrogenase
MRRAARAALRVDDPALVTHALGATFPTPVGLAAGFDKDAAGHRELAALGFGFVEVGTVTPVPQPGNPKPRLFRLPADRALVNRLGFNSGGVDAVRSSLAARPPEGAVLGVNVGKNKATSEDRAAEDYAAAARALGPLASYVAVNVSSPNTPGLRDLQAVEQLRPLLQAVRAATDRPVLVKIAPTCPTRTSTRSPTSRSSSAGRDHRDEHDDRPRRARDASGEVEAVGAGGLSGAPLRARSLAVLRRLRARTGDRLVLVAAGGIADADEAWAAHPRRATLVQLYTGFVYGGSGDAGEVATGPGARARAAGSSASRTPSGAEGRAATGLVRKRCKYALRRQPACTALHLK